VRKRALTGDLVVWEWFSFFLFFFFYLSKASIQSGNRRRELGTVLLYKAGTVDSTTKVKGKRRPEEEMQVGSEFGAASVYSIAITASLPNHWADPLTLALFFFFF
jgi:hypothetical protein